MSRKSWYYLLIMVAIMGNAPDWDALPSLFNSDFWYVAHREWGHNIFAIIGVAWMGNHILKYQMPGLKFTARNLVITAPLLSHLFLDACNSGTIVDEGNGIPLLWPFSNAHWKLPIEWYHAYEKDLSLTPILSHLASPDFWARAIFEEIYAIGFFAIPWTLAQNIR